ncbi:hypothetical protein PoB_000745600 [Plakobranchus ocellatus]|uniref:Uncharacterized protein n=1 Tax=Plakobranchus ocellatus TaxID=259542 RepID=A0AAV3YEY8_9GAST|nr:hypothetical protein PoB_000745600 [Plakobranchus ocellatus]
MYDWGVGGTVASESALRSAGTLLSRVRVLPPAPWPDGGPESLRSPWCGLAIYKTMYDYRSRPPSRFPSIVQHIINLSIRLRLVKFL